MRRSRKGGWPGRTSQVNPATNIPFPLKYRRIKPDFQQKHKKFPKVGKKRPFSGLLSGSHSQGGALSGLFFPTPGERLTLLCIVSVKQFLKGIDLFLEGVRDLVKRRA